MTDQDVRDMLRRRAADATPSPQAWDRIEERMAAADGDPAPVIDLADRRLPPMALGAIAAAVVLLVGMVVLLQGDSTESDQRLRAADGGHSADRDWAATSLITGNRLPVWPATTDGGLAELQAEVDAGRRPELRDPRAVAGQYLSERFADPETANGLLQEFAVGGFDQTGPGRGEVSYESPPGAPAGTVVLQRGGGDGAIWFVTGAASERVSIAGLTYDGARFTGHASAAGRGELAVRVGPTDGDVATSELSQPVAPDEPVALDQRISDTSGVIVHVRLTERPSGRVSFLEVRIDQLIADGPGDSTFESAAEEAARRWIGAAATGDLDLAWDTLAEDSREAVGSRARLEDRRTELAKGWGAWHGAEGVTLGVVDLMTADPGAEDAPAEIPHFGVVVLSGSIAQEGTMAFGAVSLPVRGTRAGAQVDPFAPVGIEIDGEASPGLGAAPGGPLGAYTPAMARVWFLLDDREPAPPDLVEGADGDQQHATLTPRPALSTGQHALTVVVLTADGRLASRSTITIVRT